MLFKKKEFTNNSIEYIIVGLGNPGKQYESTRHNAGFIAINYIAEELGVKINKIKFKSTIGEARISGKRCLLMKPSTYMNLSGQAVTEAMNFYKIPPQQVVILSDDISLDVGVIRIRRKGSDGGQKGLQNIIYLSGSDAFPRVKIGIGKTSRSASAKSRIPITSSRTGCSAALLTRTKNSLLIVCPISKARWNTSLTAISTRR